MKKQFIRHIFGQNVKNYSYLNGPVCFFNGFLHKNYIFERITIRRRDKLSRGETQVFINVYLLVRFTDGRHEYLHELGTIDVNKVTKRGVQMLNEPFHFSTLPQCADFILVFAASDFVPQESDFEIFCIIQPISTQIFKSLECAICLQNNTNVILKKCQHKCLCFSCFYSSSAIISRCPICRVEFKREDIFLDF